MIQELLSLTVASLTSNGDSFSFLHSERDWQNVGSDEMPLPAFFLDMPVRFTPILTASGHVENQFSCIGLFLYKSELDDTPETRYATVQKCMNACRDFLVLLKNNEDDVKSIAPEEAYQVLNLFDSNLDGVALPFKMVLRNVDSVCVGSSPKLGSNYEIKDEDGNVLYSGFLTLGTDLLETIDNSVLSVKDSEGTVLKTVSLLAESIGEITISDSQVTNSDNTFSQSVKAESPLILPDVNHIDSDGSTVIYPSAKPFTCAPAPICADTTLEVNGTTEGTFTAGSTIDVQLSDSGGVVTPTSVTVVGSAVQVLLPDGGGGSCIDEYGQIFYTDFTGSTLPAGITNTIASTVQSNELQVNSGSASYTQYLELNELMGVGDWEVKTTIEIDAKTGSNFGLAIGINSTNPFFEYEIVNHFIQSTGQIRFVRAGNNQININTSVLAFSVGHILEFSIRKIGQAMYSEIKNLNNSTSVFLNYGYVTSAPVEPITPNIGKIRLYSFAGGYTIKNLKISNLGHVGGVMYIGDSVTSGYNTTNGNCYTEVVNYPKWNCFAGAGDTTTQALLAINQLTTQNIPDVAIIMLGLNDAQAITTLQYEINLGLIVDALQGVGTTVKIIAPTPRNAVSMDTFAQKAIDVAVAKGCVYINGYALLKDPSSTNINAAYSSDGLHPNDAGHLIIANEIIANF